MAAVFKGLRFYKYLSNGCRDVITVVAGPCAAESRDMVVDSAWATQRAAASAFERVMDFDMHINFAFKVSFDKANRTTLASPRGCGFDETHKAFEILRSDSAWDWPILTDCHTESQFAETTADIVQVPALLCRQTDLLIAAGRTGKIVNIKKGQFATVAQVEQAANKVVWANGHGLVKVFATERGSCFGADECVVDVRNFRRFREADIPCLIDCTHAVKEREDSMAVALAGIAAGADGLYVEVHKDPDSAPSDGRRMTRLADLPNLIEAVARLKR